MLKTKYNSTNGLPSTLVANDIANETFNFAIRATASLFYWFAVQTGGTVIPSNLNLSSLTVSTSLPSKKAGYLSTANNSVQIVNGGRINFIGTNSIQLLPGFTAQGGGVFSSFITTCGVALTLPRIAGSDVPEAELNQTSSEEQLITALRERMKEENPEINIFPVPASKELNIDLNNITFQEIFLTDIQGKRLKNLIVKGGENSISINTGDLASGIYFLQLTTRTQTIQRKVVIEQN